MSNEVILFDLPSRGRCACWSLNPWKTRAALNFKGTPYKTEWVEYPDIAAKFKGLGILPADDDPPYAIPAARMPDGSHVMESFEIAKALEKLQPEPTLRLDSGYVERVQEAVGKSFGALYAMCLPRVPDLILNERSAGYFNRTRSARFGMSLPDLAQSDKAKAAWSNLENGSGLGELKTILHEHGDGPYVLGKDGSYADLVLAGMWAFMKRLDKGDLFDRFMSYDEAFLKHYEACSEWLERDDY